MLSRRRFIAGLLSPLITAAIIRPTSLKAQSAQEVVYLSPQQSDALLTHRPDIIVIDVRTEGEYNDGHLPDAVQINYFSPYFRSKVKELDRAKAYLIHCASGGRSQRALNIMRDEGFVQLYHMDGGYHGLMAYRESLAIEKN